MNRDRSFTAALACAALLAIAAPAHAGMPVIDIANLIQAVENVLDQAASLENEASQIEGLEQQLQSINGVRGLANIANNPLLHDYIPAAAPRILQDVSTLGTSGLAGTGRVLRDARMIYDCENVPAGQSQVACQAQLGLPYQQKGFFQDAAQVASQRMDQINALLQQAATTQDPKAAQEIQARISGEAAMLAHELTLIQLQAAQAQADDRINASRAAEAMQQTTTRTGHVADFVKLQP
jgi:type IV secretion system protein VirB5